MGNVVDIALVIVSVALIASVILQSKGAGLGGLTGADTGGIFTARRGVEKTSVLCNHRPGCSVLCLSCIIRKISITFSH